MNAFLRLVRLPNLLIILLTQYLLQYFVIAPTLISHEIIPHLNHLQFFLLVCTTICIGASGFIVNDLYDVHIDQINKPVKTVVDKYISRNRAWSYFIILILTGLAIALYLSWSLDVMELFVIYPLAVILLSLYSVVFQRIFLLGNVVVALYCALVTGIVPVAEWPSFQHLRNVDIHAYTELYSVLVAFVIFSFGITLYREIIKDMEDVEGDLEGGQKTLAIVLGQKHTKWVSSAVALGLSLSIACWLILRWDDLTWWNISYCLIFLELPLLYSCYLIRYAAGKQDFTKLSSFLKWMMLAGIVYLFFN